MQPAHDGLRMATRPYRHLGGTTACLCDVIEREEALAGAPVRRAHRQPTQVFWRLAPAGMINRQHDGAAYLLASECNAPFLPQLPPKTMSLKLDAV